MRPLGWTNMHSVSKYKALLELYLYFATPSDVRPRYILRFSVRFSAGVGT